MTGFIQHLKSEDNTVEMFFYEMDTKWEGPKARMRRFNMNKPGFGGQLIASFSISVVVNSQPS